LWTSGETAQDAIPLQTRPAAVTTNPTSVFVAAVSKQSIYYKQFYVTTTSTSITVNSFTPWKQFPGGASNFALAVTSYTTNQITVFAIGTNNALYRQVSNNGNTWTPLWEKIIALGPLTSPVVGFSLDVAYSRNWEADTINPLLGDPQVRGSENSLGITL